MNKTYYNEIDPYAVRWLHNLMVEGMIAPGDVDTRSIEDVTPNDLSGYTQCHFFAGVGVWSYALRLAGWPDNRSVWTGSCPCQPFSQAGKGAGFTDERHLWPALHHLIQERQPTVIFGEQVASKDGLAWLDIVRTDMEIEEYAFGALDTCAAGFGAPHIRQRLYWVADHDGQRLSIGREPDSGAAQSEQSAPRRADVGGCSENGGLGNANDRGSRRDARTVLGAEGSIERGVRRLADGVEFASTARELGDTERNRLRVSGRTSTDIADQSSYWSICDWIPCRDGKYRPVEPGTFPLVDVSPSRVGRLRAYGNAIVAEQAKEFIGAYLDGA